MKKQTIEVEDYYGNTIMGFNLERKKFADCEIADIEGDYIFETDDGLIRIQSNNPLIQVGKSTQEKASAITLLKVLADELEFEIIKGNEDGNDMESETIELERILIAKHILENRV